MSLTVKQFTNFNGFPKAAELIEITGAHALEASDRAVFNQLLKIAHDSNRLVDPDADWEITLSALRRASSKHESNDRVKDSLRRLRRTEVKVTYVEENTGKRRVMETHLLDFTDTEATDEASDGTVQFGIPKRLRVVLAKSNRWGRIRCEVSYAMTSKYAIALYELVCLRANREHCVEVLSYDEFRSLLNVPPGTYERGLDFQRKVVAPALLEWPVRYGRGHPITAAACARPHRRSCHLLVEEVCRRIQSCFGGTKPPEGRANGEAARRSRERRSDQSVAIVKTGQDQRHRGSHAGGGRSRSRY